jgi:hypothetical protein
MQHKRGATRMGYHAHYVVDGGKARVILNVLVTPADVTENQPMLDLLWRTAFRWRARVRRVTGDSKYGTKENVAAVERRPAYAPTSRWPTSRAAAPTTGRAGSITTPSKISTGARKGNPCACTPTPTPRGSEQVPG